MKKTNLLLCLVIVLALSFMFAGCNLFGISKPTGDPNGDAPPVENAQYEYSYVSVMINPHADFVVKDGWVKAVIGVNEDAELLLSDIDLTEQPIEDAVEAFVEAALLAGFIDVESDDNEIIVEVISSKGTEDDDEVGLIICNRINTLLDRENIVVSVKPGLLDRYPGLLDEYPGLLDRYPGLLDRYPGLLDEYPGLLDKYPGLLDEYPGLLDRYPGLLDRYPGLLDKYPGLLDEYPGLLEEYPGLLEEYPGLLDKYPGLLDEYPGLLDRYPGLLDKYPDLLDEYPGLLDRKRGLLDKYPGLLDEYPGLLDKYPGLLDRYPGLLDKYPGLLDRYPGLLDRELGLLDRYPGLLDRYPGLLDRYFGLLDKEQPVFGWLKAAVSALEIFPDLDIEDVYGLNTDSIIDLIYRKTFDGVVSAQIREEFRDAKQTLLDSEEYNSLAAYQGQIRNPHFQPEGLDPWHPRIEEILDQEFGQYELISKQFKNELAIIKQQFMLDTGSIKDLLEQQKSDLIEEYRPVLEKYRREVQENESDSLAPNHLAH